MNKAKVYTDWESFKELAQARTTTARWFELDGDWIQAEIHLQMPSEPVIAVFRQQLKVKSKLDTRITELEYLGFHRVVNEDYLSLQDYLKKG